MCLIRFTLISKQTVLGNFDASRNDFDGTIPQSYGNMIALGKLGRGTYAKYGMFDARSHDPYHVTNLRLYVFV
jgi:muconolactone delta-isomerase